MVLPERQQVKSSREVEHGSKKIQDQHDCSLGMDERNSPSSGAMVVSWPLEFRT